MWCGLFHYDNFTSFRFSKSLLPCNWYIPIHVLYMKQLNFKCTKVCYLYSCSYAQLKRIRRKCFLVFGSYHNNTNVYLFTVQNEIAFNHLFTVKLKQKIITVFEELGLVYGLCVQLAPNWKSNWNWILFALKGIWICFTSYSIWKIVIDFFENGKINSLISTEHNDVLLSVCMY